MVDFSLIILGQREKIDACPGKDHKNKRNTDQSFLIHFYLFHPPKQVTCPPVRPLTFWGKLQSNSRMYAVKDLPNYAVDFGVLFNLFGIALTFLLVVYGMSTAQFPIQSRDE